MPQNSRPLFVRVFFRRKRQYVVVQDRHGRLRAFARVQEAEGVTVVRVHRRADAPGAAPIWTGHPAVADERMNFQGDFSAAPCGGLSL